MWLVKKTAANKYHWVKFRMYHSRIHRSCWMGALSDTIILICTKSKRRNTPLENVFTGLMSLKENILWPKEPSWNYYVGSHSFNTDQLLVQRSCHYFMWPFISTSTYFFLTLVKAITLSFMGLEEEMVKLISILVFHFCSGWIWPSPDLFDHNTTCSWL